MLSPLRSPDPRRSAAALSLVEILLAVGAMALVSTASVIAITNVNRSSQHQKLDSDVRTINSAISLYLSNGGSLESASDPEAVLARLKTSRSKSGKERHAGAPSGRLVDPRVTIGHVPEDSWKRRARFLPEIQRFEAFPSGPGVEFLLDESLAEVSAAIEDRSRDAVNYAANSTWVWDHGAPRNPSAPHGPSSFRTNPDVRNSTPTTKEPTPQPEPDPGPPSPPPPPSPPAPPRLPAPVFSPAGGAHPESRFPLSVSIANLASASGGDPIYQLGSGAWTPYAGPIDVPMNTQLRAQFLAKDPSAHRDSPQRSAHYYPVPESLSGTVESHFHSPAGGPNLAYQITNDGDRFAHGDPIFILDGEPINSGDPNILSFSSQAFSDVPPGQKFKLGDFHYHNGSTYYDSHATGVKLGITISLPERGQAISFDLNLDLVNTENDPDDADASADYVKITNLTQNIPLQINGVNYRIQLEFGATDSFGFSSQSQFHVYEGATGQGELLGTFLPR